MESSLDSSMSQSPASLSLRKRILICGHRAFAARGLAELLQRQGHRVERFSRNLPQCDDGSIGGPVFGLDVNPHLGPLYDTVINFIVLKGRSVADNIAYFESLLRMCRGREVKHLIQISSTTVYRDSVRIVTEHAATKTYSSRRGGYASSKVAAERYLSQHASGIKVSLVRPACIVGGGMPDPIGSVGVCLPTRELLVLGTGRRRRPIIVRSVLHEAIARLVRHPPQSELETLLVVDRDSPTCLEYLQGCCDILKLGTRAVSRPTPFWFGAFVRRELEKGSDALSIARFVGNLAQRCIRQEYEPSWTERRLGLEFTADWRSELAWRGEPSLRESDAYPLLESAIETR